MAVSAVERFPKQVFTRDQIEAERLGRQRQSGVLSVTIREDEANWILETKLGELQGIRPIEAWPQPH